MTDAQWQRVRDLFERGVDRDLADVTAWLDVEAADDPDVQAEVASLLRHHSQAGDFLAEPVTARVSHLLSDDARFEAGAAVGPYTIQREIGRGGMGRVYLATDTRLGRTVALKALPPAVVDDPRQRERLRREARAAAALTHPGICTIYALEEMGDDVFIAAEYVEGRTLREEIESGVRPSADELTTTARSLADALASAHAKGITHRDLKPENIMRANDGRLKILDFGLAIVQSESHGPATRVTATGAIIGTPAYMSPEQLNGATGDARSDVFALGVLLYEYATGEHPFAAQTLLALAARILESEPRGVQGIRRDLPLAVAMTIDRSLRKAPADRFQSASEVLDSLGNTGAVQPATPVTHVARWWRAHQVTALALYFASVVTAWGVKESQHGWPDTLFVFVGVAAAIAGVFRGHLLFTERMNRSSFDAERRRAEPITLIVDTLIGLALAFDGWQLAAARPVAGLLTIALGVGVALARLVIESSTTRGAFEN